MKVGVDVGGTFTDLLLTDEDGAVQVGKVLSTPDDPSIGLLTGLEEIARERGQSLADLVGRISTIVHGTTVTTNVVLTGTGANTGLITTEGVRDALEMRRGIREEQYNNRYTNVPPLVPRYLRRPVRGRLDFAGGEVEPLGVADVERAVEFLREQGVEAVAVCFMNSFANPEHERQAAEIVRARLAEAYVTVSTEVLPSIRFYPRVSTTVLNSYVGPVLNRYLESLTQRLREVGFSGVLLIMQSNGGVVSPEMARAQAAVTLLSGPAAGPSAGMAFAEPHGYRDYITVDMGGTSFDAALVRDGQPLTVTEGQVNRYALALPMLDIVTIGAGGGSVGWLDEGGLLRVGPRSAGANPGPACYARGGTEPTVTDADLVLARLDPAFFAGGRMPLDEEAARGAIEERIAGPLGLSVAEAAAGIARVVDSNMAAWYQLSG
jgi:N-methylhydantoinase A